MSRPIRDAKDITTGKKVYFKGHAQATFMSDGRTVETAINEAMQGGGSGVVSVDDVYVFEWDGETDSGTLSEAEVAKLWSAKSVVVGGAGGAMMYADRQLSDDVCTLIVQFWQPFDATLYLSLLIWEISSDGNWTNTFQQYTYQIPAEVSETTVTKWGFYKKPSTGIPDSDLSEGVQAMLNEVYVFEWDGAESGTLSEAELAKLLGAKYVIISHSSGWAVGAIKDNSDDKSLILFSQTYSMGIELLGVSYFAWEVTKTGEWTMQSDGATYPQPTEELIKDMGFATTDEVNTAIQDAVTNALNTAV